MTQKIPFEPFSIWKEMYEQTEKAWHDVIQKTLGTETFSEGLGQIQNSYLQYHEMVSNMAEAYFKQANIPTPDEIANVASLVINLEEKVDTIDDQLYEAIQTSSEQHSQLKNSITSLENKFDQILEAISNLDRKITSFETTLTSKAPTSPKKKPGPKKASTEKENTDIN